MGGGGYPHHKKERAWVLVADWSRGSIKMAGVQADGCVFCHHAIQGSREPTRVSETMEAEKPGESERAGQNMAG